VLREAYAAHVADVFAAPITADNVVVTAGCNQAFFLSVMTVAQAGDAVMMPTPWYFNYRMALDMLGVDAVPLPGSAQSGFLPDPEQAEALLTDRVRAIVLITPNNPTGAVYPPDLLARFADLCRRRDIWLILDETYRDFRGPDAAAPHDLFSDPDWGDWLIGLYSFSKAYCIPGHRMGAVLGSPLVVAELGKALDTLQICPPRPPQAPLAWAIGALGDWRRDNAAEIARRAVAFRNAMAQAPDFRVEAVGAYFAYLCHPFEGVPSDAVARSLARECGILCLPGDYFGPGQERQLRVAFANAGSDALAALGPRLAGFEAIMATA
jgi:aspartate/methionine/tyrosine aminotransferase